MDDLLRLAKAPWYVGRTFNTHNSPTRFWETSILSANNRHVATTSGETQEEAEAIAALIISAVNNGKDILTALCFVKGWFLNLEDGLPADDPLSVLRAQYHAPVHKALDEAIAKAGK